MKINSLSAIWNEVSAYISDDGNICLEEKKEKNSCFPENGKFAKFFNKESPKDQLTFTITAEDFIKLVMHEMSIGLIDETGSNHLYFNLNSFNGGGYYDIFEAERITNNNLLSLLIEKYKAGNEKISDDLEHKLIWLYPPFAESLGLDKISYKGKLIYLYRRPNGIINFTKSTTEMQLIAVDSSWEYIRSIKRPHVEALNAAAKKAIIYYEEKAKDLRRWKTSELSDYDTKEMKKDYKFFNKYKFDPIIKQDILGTIMSIFLEHEMKPFI